jgi:triosephosphate isomerase
VIVDGYKWPIKDFGLSDPKSGMDMKDSLLQNEGFQLLWVVPFVDKTYMDAIPEIRETWKWAGGKNVQMLAVTATGFESAAEFAKTNKLEFSFLGADEKMLKTMARYNSTLYLMNGPVVVDKWSSRNLPSTSKLDKLIRK